MASAERFVKVPKELAAMCSVDEGTRIYRAEGDDNAYRRWTDCLFSSFPRGLVSPGGACKYAGVSRAAVHKAMREGRLTVFAFHELKKVRSIFGTAQRRETPYLFVPIDECKAWHEELVQWVKEKRALSDAELREELEGRKPDWMARFLDAPVKRRRGK